MSMDSDKAHWNYGHREYIIMEHRGAISYFNDDSFYHN